MSIKKCPWTHQATLSSSNKYRSPCYAWATQLVVPPSACVDSRIFTNLQVCERPAGLGWRNFQTQCGNGCGLDNNWSTWASARASQMVGEQRLKTPMDPPMHFKYIEQASKPVLRMGHSICWVTQIKESSFLYSWVFQCIVIFLPCV